MSILPSSYPQQVPVYLRSGDPIALPEHFQYVNMREYLRKQTVAGNTERALELLGTKKDSVKVRSISEYPYNCVGMVLGNRRAWIDLVTEEIETSLKLDGYAKTSQDKLSVGDVVLYKNEDEFTHIGVVISVDIRDVVDIWVLSKWGFAGEMIHHLHDVPSEYGLASQFWSERVPYGTA